MTDRELIGRWCAGWRRMSHRSINEGAREMTQDKWISVDDRMPDIDGPDVLVVDKNGEYGIGCTFGVCELGDEENERTIIAAFGNIVDKMNITHWMPLPPPPGEHP